jgi:hypothetical protein
MGGFAVVRQEAKLEAGTSRRWQVGEINIHRASKVEMT